MLLVNVITATRQVTMIVERINTLLSYQIISVGTDKTDVNELYFYVFGQLILSVVPIKNTDMQSKVTRGAMYYSKCIIYPLDEEFNRPLQNLRTARQLITKCMSKIGMEINIEAKRIMNQEWS